MDKLFIIFSNRSFLDIVEKDQKPVFLNQRVPPISVYFNLKWCAKFQIYRLLIRDSDWLNFIHFSGYKIRLVSISWKREDHALISISIILKFSALINYKIVVKITRIDDWRIKEKAALLAEHKKTEDLLETTLSPNRPPAKQRVMTPKVGIIIYFM